MAASGVRVDKKRLSEPIVALQAIQAVYRPRLREREVEGDGESEGEERRDDERGHAGGADAL